MLKIEKLKKEIKNFDTENSLSCKLALWSLNIKDHDSCSRDSHISCSECVKMSLLTLLEEYKEPIKLTKFEYEYLKYVRRLGNNYVARDKDNEIYAFSNKPHQNGSVWESEIGNGCVLHFDGLFTFVKWDDEESWEIEEILSNCEVVEDE